MTSRLGHPRANRLQQEDRKRLLTAPRFGRFAAFAAERNDRSARRAYPRRDPSRLVRGHQQPLYTIFESAIRPVITVITGACSSGCDSSPRAAGDRP